MTVELLWKVNRSVELWVFVLLAAHDHQHCISVGLEYGQLLHSEKSFGRREIALCPSYHLLCWNLKVCIYFPVSTELWEPVLFEKPSRSKLSSPHRDTGMTQAVRDSFPFVGNLWPENLPIFHKTVWELGGEKGPVRMLLFPERGCRSVACWVIPTALYRAFLAFLLNMMFLEWERKEVFFSPPQTPPPQICAAHSLLVTVLPSVVLRLFSLFRPLSTFIYHCVTMWALRHLLGLVPPVGFQDVT